MEQQLGKRNDEVDFILRKKNSLMAIEIKGNAEKRTEGLDKFRGLFKPTSSFRLTSRIPTEVRDAT